jgi:hypothetical protein
LKTLDDEIEQREVLGSELRRNQDFKGLTKVEQERNALTQVQYGIQELPYLGEPERLKERGLEESDIWKAAQSMAGEIKGKAQMRVVQQEQENLPIIDGSELEKQEELEHEQDTRDRQGKNSQLPGVNMADVQEAEKKASIIQGLNKSADGLSYIEGKDIGYTEEQYVIAATQVRYEAQLARTADGEAKAQGAEVKIPREGERVTVTPRGRDGGPSYTGSVKGVNEKGDVTLKSGNKLLTIQQGKGEFRPAPPLGKDQAPKHAKNVAQSKMGPKCDIYFAKDKGSYKGPIIGLTGTPPTYAIQKINNEAAVLHRLKDLRSAEKDGQGFIKEGQSVSIEKNENGISIVSWNEQQEREKQ